MSARPAVPALTVVTRDGETIADVGIAGRAPDQRLRVAMRLAKAAAAALGEGVFLVGRVHGKRRRFPVWPGDAETDLIRRAFVEGGNYVRDDGRRTRIPTSSEEHERRRMRMRPDGSYFR